MKWFQFIITGKTLNQQFWAATCYATTGTIMIFLGNIYAVFGWFFACLAQFVIHFSHVFPDWVYEDNFVDVVKDWIEGCIETLER